MVDEEKVAESPSLEQRTFLILFIIGFFIIFLGIITLIIASLVYGEGANFGGIIFIWFIPIVFGVGPESKWIVLFALILAILGMVMFLIMRRKIKKT